MDRYCLSISEVNSNPKLFFDSSHFWPSFLFTFRDEAKVIKNDCLHIFSMGKANMFTFSCYCINRYTKLSNYMSVTVSFPSGLLSGQSTYVPCLNLLLSKNKLQVGRGPVQFSSVSQSCPTLCSPKYCSTQGLPVHHELPEITQTHVH